MNPLGREGPRINVRTVHYDLPFPIQELLRQRRHLTAEQHVRLESTRVLDEEYGPVVIAYLSGIIDGVELLEGRSPAGISVDIEHCERCRMEFAFVEGAS